MAKKKSWALEYAEREIKLASQRDGNTSDTSYEYAMLCYNSALKAYKSLLKDQHSGNSWAITRQILNRLTKSLPLTPVTEANADWQERPMFSNSDKKVFQSNRYSSLFKYIASDGTISYSANDRCTIFDTGRKETYYRGLELNLMDEVKPITLPYYPLSEPIIVYAQNISFHNDSSRDATMISGYYDPEDHLMHPIGKAYKVESGSYVEITSEEFYKLQKEY